MTLSVIPLDGPLGCVVEGVDPSRPPSEEEFLFLKKAMLEHLAFVIPDLPEDPHWLLDLGRRFGPLVPHVLDQYHHPLTPEMSVIAMHLEGEVSRRTQKPAGAFWHSDLSYKGAPSDAIFLYASRVPSRGGDTMIANMYLAYETLPSHTKARISGRTAIHRYGWRGGAAITPLTAEQKAATPDVEHPVVRVHPETGRKSLFVNPGYTVRILGMEERESEELLEELFEHALRPEFRYRHRWQVGQLLGLDNRASIHCAVDDYDEPRRMLRMIVGGTEDRLRMG